MGTIESFEAEYGIPSSKWTKQQWREVALTLAKQKDEASKPKKRGPKGPRIPPDNIAALSYWAQCEQDNAVAGILDDAIYHDLEPGGQFREGDLAISTKPGKRITLKEGIRRVMLQSGELSTRNGRPVSNAKADAKLDATVKQVQLFQRKLKMRK